MKRIYISILGVLSLGILTVKADSQNYSFDPAKISHVEIPLGYGVDVFSEIKVNNLTGSKLYINYQLLSNTFQVGWDYTLCDNSTCYTGIPADEKQQIINAGSYGFFKLDIKSENIAGNGEVKILVYEPGNQANADTVIFQVSTLTGITSNKLNENSINLFPNPVKDQLNLTLTNYLAKAQSFQLYNVVGEQIHEIQFVSTGRNFKTNVEMLLPGVYFIKYTDDSGNSIVKKFYKI